MESAAGNTGAELDYSRNSWEQVEIRIAVARVAVIVVVSEEIKTEAVNC